MKTSILTLLLGVVLCSSTFAGTSQTVANLQLAYKGELTASAKYMAYSVQARKEGYTQIAILFSALSRSEAIHADNHKKVLVKLGQTAENVVPNVTAKSTKENLEEAIQGESSEVNTMYPGYINTAKEENSLDAVKSFRWAMETEKKHLVMCENAQNALNANKVNTLPKIYWVCPKCGNTYDVAKPEPECSFCGTKSAMFIKFDK
ncbi:MAG TPA: rubrerythrin family protein [Bacteroidales bacterium]|nr:rubrerythrin family protein [Bacteroidales bacterium]